MIFFSLLFPLIMKSFVINVFRCYRDRPSHRQIASQSGVDLTFSNAKALSDLYDTCNENLCIGLSGQSIESKSCDLVVGVTASGYGLSDGKVAFQMIGKTSNGDESNTGWIGMALSMDDKMGTDSVVDCLVVSDGKSYFRDSWNTKDKKNEELTAVEGVEATGNVIVEGGLINCNGHELLRQLLRIYC